MINKGGDALGAEDLRVLSQYLEGLSFRALGVDESGLTHAQFRILEALGDGTPSKARVLADQVGMPPSTMSRVCDRLVANGLISREPNPESRREVLLTITPAGSEVVRRVCERRFAGWAQILEHVPTQSRQAVADAVGLLSTAAQDDSAAAFRSR